jgi:hypothetical protein
VDLIGIRKPLLLLIDCKHWKHGYMRSKFLKAIDNQHIRAQAFAAYLKRNVNLKGFTIKPGKYFILPVLVSLTDPFKNILNGIPIVSVIKFKDFLKHISPIPINEHIKYIPIEIKLKQLTLGK